MKTYARIRRFASLAIPLSIVVFSVLLLKFPTLFNLTTDRVTLVVLALVGCEFLLERLCYLEHIPEILTKVKKCDGRGKAFGHRGDFGSTTEMIRNVKRKMYISGITLDAMVHHIELLQEKAIQKIPIKLLLISPNPELMKQCSAYLGENDTATLHKLHANLQILHERLQSKNPRTVEIRTISHRPAFGYAIIDSDDNNGFIRVESYTCKGGPVSRPMMQFRRQTEPDEFSAYSSDFDRLWGLACRYSPQSDKLATE